MAKCENCNNEATGHSLDDIPLCDACGYALEKEAEKSICPECLTPTTQDELDMFGGLCEECSVDW